MIIINMKWKIIYNLFLKTLLRVYILFLTLDLTKTIDHILLQVVLAPRLREYQLDRN